MEPHAAAQVQEYKEENRQAEAFTGQLLRSKRRNYKWWIKVSIHIIFVLLGQSVALILGRLYFVKGGNSKWLATLVQIIGYPILLPYLLLSNQKHPAPAPNEVYIKPPSMLIRVMIYLGLGILVSADCFLYSIGMQYLPVSTFTLISASQLAFNSLFSSFLNSQKFTPYVVNSLVLLTISSVLLVYNKESENTTEASSGKHVIGFVCTVAASAGYGLTLSLTQLCFEKVLKIHSFKVVMEMIIYEGIISSVVTLCGFFVSGEWSTLTTEMNNYRLGNASYVMNLVWTAIAWQVFTIGCVGLIFELSSLFSNAISVLGLPIVPVVAVFVFHDRMTGIKAISMVLAVWGFISYGYQHYLDDCSRRSKTDEINSSDNAVSSSAPKQATEA